MRSHPGKPHLLPYFMKMLASCHLLYLMPSFLLFLENHPQAGKTSERNRLERFECFISLFVSFLLSHSDWHLESNFFFQKVKLLLFSWVLLVYFLR